VSNNADSIKLLKLNHINAIVDGHQSSLDHFVGRLGMQLNMLIPDRGDGTEACLVSLGNVMFELFAPKQRSERGQGRLLDLYGDHYLGAEYQVPDVEAARALCAAHDVRILNDVGHFFFTHPRDCFGVAWELWDGDWHADHPDKPDFTSVLPASYWRDEHPLGVTGLACIRAVVDDLAGATARYEQAFGATVRYRETRPAVAADAVGVRLADTVIELLAPTGEGETAAFLERYGPRIRSSVFTVADAARAASHLASLGIPLLDGDDERSRLLDPAHNHGLRFEITDQPRS
jgi:catechol 2,3-dioxygenase-like lactoylglutathione lyase family enzyme